MKKNIWIIVIALFLGGFLYAQDSGLGFNMDLGLGVSSFTDPTTGELTTWQNLRLQPDLSLGKFGIGLDLTINYRFSDASGNSGFSIREEDWVPSTTLGTSFLDLYLPIFRYIRYGTKGEPLFVKLGSIDDATVGNGFIIGNYSNSLFMPQRRIVGLSLDFDAMLFDFPYLGIETFVSNLAAFNLIGARLYTRPLAWTGVPIIETAQFGVTVAADLNPFYYEEQDFKELRVSEPTATNAYSSFWGDTTNDSDASNNNGTESVVIGGIDIRVPILNTDIISLATFTDLVLQRSNPGWMIGAGGRLLKVMNFGAQIRVLGENFIPVYFDQSYDLYRSKKWEVYNGFASTPSYAGWFATLGMFLADGLFTFDASIEGSFSNPDNNPQLDPVLRGKLFVSPDLLAGFSIMGSYEKRAIDSWSDFISAEDSVIGAGIGYKTGPAQINLIYDIRYNPNSGTGQNWESTSRIETTISF
ncbi:MAG: hypothetical protein GW949_01800 [Spirochaetales bacterium]|nr:hypothetical protein [Spirochaetales bacterium]